MQGAGAGTALASGVRHSQYHAATPAPTNNKPMRFHAMRDPSSGVAAALVAAHRSRGRPVGNVLTKKGRSWWAALAESTRGASVAEHG
jgi:hypothetical protein